MSTEEIENLITQNSDLDAEMVGSLLTLTMRNEAKLEAILTQQALILSNQTGVSTSDINKHISEMVTDRYDAAIRRYWEYLADKLNKR